MRVGINGIGIAGPTLAYWLRRFGHEPVLFERAPRLRTGGYLIDFWGLGYDLAERMNLLPGVLAHGYRMERLSLVDAHGRESAGLDVGKMRYLLNGRFVSLARSELSALIFQACEGCETHFGTSIDAVHDDGARVTATLSDGRRESFDLVVGADGLHSRIRAAVFGPAEQYERSLGCRVAAFRLRHYPGRSDLAYVSHTVPGRHAARVALHTGETLVLLIWRTDLPGGRMPLDAPKAALRAVFSGMEWEVPEMLARLDEAGEIYADEVSQIHLPRWSAGRTALIGDAAACASLLAGEGTGLAMIEAYVLAGELHRSAGNVPDALAAFERRLRPFVEGKQRAAVGFRGFFVPATRLGLGVRNALVNAFAWPGVGAYFIRRELRDDFVLPDYG